MTDKQQNLDERLDALADFLGREFPRAMEDITINTITPDGDDGVLYYVFTRYSWGEHTVLDLGLSDRDNIRLWSRQLEIHNPISFDDSALKHPQAA